MALTLTVLGCSGSYPAAGTPTSGYLVRSSTTAIWLDAGSGTLANLQRHLDLTELDALVISHSHDDHWVDVLGLYTAYRYYAGRRGFPILAPAAVRTACESLTGATDPTFDWRVTADADTATIGDLRLQFSRTDHPPETLAVRIDDPNGASVGYSADTGPGWSLSELGPGLDLALCEATLLDPAERRYQHLTAKEAGVSARAAGARRLVLTHLRPGLDREEARALAAAAFGGPVAVAAVDDQYEITTTEETP